MGTHRSEVKVIHNAAARRFEATVDGQFCRLDYVLDDDTLRLTHTEVPSAVGGRGVAAELVRTALDYATEQGYRVVPACGYVRAYMRRHPQARELLPGGFAL